MSLNDNPWGASVPSSKPAPQPKRLGGPPPKLSKRMSEKFERTKEAASIGMDKTKDAASAGVKKVKTGASNGVNWLKLKYHKNKLFSKK